MSASHNAILSRRPWLAQSGWYTSGFSRADAQDPQRAGEIGTRLIAAYRAACADAPRTPRAVDVWSGIFAAWYHDFIALLERGDPLALCAYLRALPRQPAAHGYFQGRAAFEELSANEQARHVRGVSLMDYLVSMAEAVGVLPVRSPEQTGWDELPGVTASDLCAAIERRIGLPLRLPPVFDGLFALEPAAGALHLRSVMATYAVWQLASLMAAFDGAAPAALRIAELGAGIGYTAFAAQALGVAGYTLFDLPEVNVAQGYFLLCSAAAPRVALYGEPHAGKSLRVLPAFALHALSGTAYDAVLNMDSLPEIARADADAYVRSMRRCARYFYSVNQETEAPQSAQARQPRVAELVDACGGFRALLRFPNWIRPGYVEELWRVER